MNLNYSKTILTIMNVLFWIVFIGLCIETGALLVNYLYSVFINPETTYKLYNKLDLHKLFQKDIVGYHIVMISKLIVSGLKTFIAYKVVKLFMILKLENPFTLQTTKFVKEISYWVFIYAIFPIFVNSGYIDQLNIPKTKIEWNINETLFFAGLIYIIAVIMQRGTEIQDENDLTV